MLVYACRKIIAYFLEIGIMDFYFKLNICFKNMNLRTFHFKSILTFDFEIFRTFCFIFPVLTVQEFLTKIGSCLHNLAPILVNQSAISQMNIIAYFTSKYWAESLSILRYIRYFSFHCKVHCGVLFFI